MKRLRKILPQVDSNYWLNNEIFEVEIACRLLAPLNVLLISLSYIPVSSITKQKMQSFLVNSRNKLGMWCYPYPKRNR